MLALLNAFHANTDQNEPVSSSPAWGGARDESTHSLLDPGDGRWNTGLIARLAPRTSGCSGSGLRHGCVLPPDAGSAGGRVWTGATRPAIACPERQIPTIIRIHLPASSKRSAAP